MCMKFIENDNAADSFKIYKSHIKERAAELVTRLQSAKNRITDLDEEITKQNLKNMNLLRQWNVNSKLTEKMKSDIERFSIFVETENSLELFVNENKETSSNILHNLISDQTLINLESSSVKFAFEVKFENILTLKNGSQISDS